jgi:ribosomal protein S18 acetylase RimI-like enzyme
MNTSQVHSAFRAFLQGPDGGYMGDLKGAAIAAIQNEKCLAVAAIFHDRTWLVHSTDKSALWRLLDVALAKLKPLRIEGEAEQVQIALAHPKLAKTKPVSIQECLHLELAQRKLPKGSAGHQRFANANDIPRLEEYCAEYEAELGGTLPREWRSLIAENRILLGIFEGTIAAVVQRGPSTLDRVQLEGLYTFKAFRRRGLAKSLIAALARQAAGRDQATSAIVGKDNAPMLELLRDLEFNVTAEYEIAILGKAGKSENPAAKSGE